MGIYNSHKIFLDCVDSTNAWAKRQIEWIEDRTIICAKVQTQGKGRLDRIWISDKPDNVYMSICLKFPQVDVKNLPLVNLTQYLAVKLSLTIESYGIKAQIKWPNDVLINGKKIAGILTECIWQGDRLKGLILGIGVNLNLDIDDLSRISQSATSLNIELNRNIKLESFQDCLIKNFFEDYEVFLEKGFKIIKKDYLERFIFLNCKICVKMLKEEVIGIAQSVNDDGTLSILSEDGEIERINIGDIV